MVASGTVVSLIMFKLEPFVYLLLNLQLHLISQLICSDMEKLVVLTMFYGGKMQRMLDSSVTHLVTMDTSGVGQLICTLYYQSITQ